MIYSLTTNDLQFYNKTRIFATKYLRRQIYLTSCLEQQDWKMMMYVTRHVIKMVGVDIKVVSGTRGR